MKKNISIYFLNFLFCFGIFNIMFSQELEEAVNFIEYSYIPGYAKKKRKNSALFQGNKKKKKYFEGWYFKMVSNDESSIIIVIPGISLSDNGDHKQAFIQIIDGKTAKTYYYKYPIEEFSFSSKRFAIRIGNNYFSKDSITLNIENDTTLVKGKVYMTDQVKLTQNNKKRKELDIMGWYKSAPFMQCYHGVVSLNHNLSGYILKDNKTYNFDKGLGYIEKDWGKSMPSSWIWIQSNNFSSSKTSFMLSVANVPWMGSSFPGFLGFFLNDSIVNRFGTYSKAKITIEELNSDTLKITISDKNYIYYLETYRDKSGILKAPVKGSMDRRIAESVDAQLKLTIKNKKGTILFQDKTSIAGLEIVGNIKELGTIKKNNKP